MRILKIVGTIMFLTPICFLLVIVHKEMFPFILWVDSFVIGYFLTSFAESVKKDEDSFSTQHTLDLK